MRLKEAIASASLDFDRDSQLAYVDRDAGQTVAVATTAGRTTMGWLHSAMLTRQPFCLCVYVHALERRRERQRLKLAYRRLFTINRGAESRGRVPDFDRYVQEREYEGLLNQLATGQQTGLFHVSIYEQLRARGPDPDLSALSEAVDFCTEQIESAGDCKVNAGTFRQQRLWESVLPLGRDVAAQVRKYPTVNAADMLPLVGTKCGSPTGVPFAFADPGRTVELLNLYDELHPNHTLLIAGRAGAGKTMTANVLMSHCVAAGARAFVIDRAGHYETLSRLVDGAQQIEIGAEGSPYALNPWDVPDPAKVPREKVAFLIALHQVMMGRLDGQQLGMLASGIRAVYGKAAALGASPTESMLREELRAQADDAQKADAPEIAADASQPRRPAGRVLRRGHLRLPARPAHDGSAGQPAGDLRHPRLPGEPAAARDVPAHGIRHRHRPAPLGDAPSRRGQAGRADVPRPVDDADRRGLASDPPRRDRRVRQRPRPPRPSPRARADRDEPAALRLQHRLRQGARAQLRAAAAARPEPAGDPVHRRDRRALRARSDELGRLKTIKGRHAQMLWLNGARGHGKVTLRVGPTEYWAFTSDPTEVAMRDQQIAEHDGNVWAAINALARRGTRAHRDQPPRSPRPCRSALRQSGWDG